MAKYDSDAHEPQSHTENHLSPLRFITRREIVTTQYQRPAPGYEPDADLAHQMNGTPDGLFYARRRDAGAHGCRS